MRSLHMYRENDRNDPPAKNRGYFELSKKIEKSIIPQRRNTLKKMDIKAKKNNQQMKSL